ncbi:MAG: hypothetical protein Q9206_001819 [Seirophora lacunosa]
MLSTRFEDWGLGSRRAGLFPMLGEGIFTQDGRPWKHSRELLRRQFVRINFKDLSNFDPHVDDLVASLSSAEGLVASFASHSPLLLRSALETPDPALGDAGEQSKTESQTLIRDLYEELKDPDLVRDQLVHVLIAGRDATACLMSWTFFLLVRHPQAFERLKKEIHSTLGAEGRLSRTDLPHLPYLRCVLNETLRLYPQLPINVRFALKTTLLPA